MTLVTLVLQWSYMGSCWSPCKYFGQKKSHGRLQSSPKFFTGVTIVSNWVFGQQSSCHIFPSILVVPGKATGSDAGVSGKIKSLSQPLIVSAAVPRPLNPYQNQSRIKSVIDSPGTWRLKISDGKPTTIWTIERRKRKIMRRSRFIFIFSLRKH